MKPKNKKELVLDEWLSSQSKLQTVASRVLVKGIDLCEGHTGAYFGINTWTKHDLAEHWQEAAESKFDLGDEVQLFFVVPGSPAEISGLKAGDVIVKLNEQAVVSGKEAKKLFAENLKTTAKDNASVNFTIRRNAEEQKIQVASSTACDFQVQLIQNDQKNAYADGKNILITQGMIDFFKSDEEIALVVSHELAHNSMKHIDAKEKNSMIGGIIGVLLDVVAAAGGVNTNGDFTRIGLNAGAGAYSVEFEQEADYVGLYFMALSGYKIEGAANFWRRMAIADPKAITMKSSHPTSPERFVAIENIMQEINEKIESGQPLKPELKSKQAAKNSEN